MGISTGHRGFVCAVLSQTHADVGRVLKHLTPLPAPSYAYADCREMIDYVIRERGRETYESVGISRPPQAGIDPFSGRWPQVLIEIFSVTNALLPWCLVGRVARQLLSHDSLPGEQFAAAPCSRSACATVLPSRSAVEPDQVNRSVHRSTRRHSIAARRSLVVKCAESI